MGLVKVLSDSGSPVDSKIWASVRLRRCRTVTQDLRNARPEVCRLLRPSSTLWLDPATRSAGLAGHVSLMFQQAVRLDGRFGPASCMSIFSRNLIIFTIIGHFSTTFYGQFNRILRYTITNSHIIYTRTRIYMDVR